MAHSSLHFLVGLTVGSIAFAPVVIRPWRQKRPFARPIRTWLLIAYTAAIWAIVPNLLNFAGVPESVCRGWWMNLFFLHPMIDRWKDGGMLIGQLGTALIMAGHYSVLLLAILRASNDNR